ncbi:permease for cytosine/purines, uracil, thiamine, allantoin-domain-containing protein [Melanogaster broomeanus]|nr:permease for cytosine/purines, uracil, thiamine, allantoin-domain-containing protein [Melanogaster broomeanus]
MVFGVDFSRFKLSAWELDLEETTFASGKGWSNKDMDPVPPHLRTWSAWSYVSYWFSDASNIAVWEVPSSMLAIGLSWRQALPAIVVAYVITAIPMIMTGTIGARLRVPFSVLNRSSFGFWFSYFPVVTRGIIAMSWFGIQTYNGSECIYQMLKAIWPSIANVPNHIPASSNITSVGMMCYLIYWLVQLPFMLLSPHQIRYLWMAKGIIVPIAWLAMVIWAFIKVPPSVGLFNQHATLEGSALTWAWLKALNSALSLYCGYAVNIPDFTRYATSERAQLVQAATIPFVFTLCSFAGLAVTSAGIVLYGSALWDPLKLIDKWDNRPAAFFAAFAFLLTTIGTNISANALVAANDLTVCLPRWVNIRRGQVLCAILGGWVFCPWEVLANATGFLAFLNGYTIFIGPFTGIMIVDYWLVHRTRVDVPAMYNPRGRYRYTYGANWRAVATLVISITPAMPGLASSINPSLNVGVVGQLFTIGWIFTFSTSSVVYLILSLAFPAKDTFVEKAVLPHGSETTESSTMEVFQDKESITP